MAWTTPRTWVAGEVLTAALLNTHVRDNLVDVDSRLDALEVEAYFQGEAISGTLTSGADAEIGFGSSSGTFLNTPDSNDDSFTVSTSVNTAGTYNIEVPAAGVAVGFWHVVWGTESATGYREGHPQHEGSNIAYTVQRHIGSASFQTQKTYDFIVPVANDDELSIDLHQNSGGNLTIAATALTVAIKADQ